MKWLNTWCLVKMVPKTIPTLWRSIHSESSRDQTGSWLKSLIQEPHCMLKTRCRVSNDSEKRRKSALTDWEQGLRREQDQTFSTQQVNTLLAFRWVHGCHHKTSLVSQSVNQHLSSVEQLALHPSDSLLLTSLITCQEILNHSMEVFHT